MEPREVYGADELGQVVRELRRQKGWSQATLAQWLGVTRPTIAKLELTGSVNTVLALRALTVLGAVPTLHMKTDRLVRRAEAEA